MAIWIYEESRPHDYERDEKNVDRSERFIVSTPDSCPYCRSLLVVLAGKPLREDAYKGMMCHERVLLGCQSCGWWSASLLDAEAPFMTHDGGYAYLYRSHGVLKELNPADVSIPIEELRTYLIAKYRDRFDVHPRNYEQIVGSVFSDFGFRVRVTSYSGDGGIDVFVLDGDDEATVGVQVKRYRGKITAEQIRSFVGALMLQGLTAGIYVTTSSYERGAVRTANAAESQLGLPVTLMDARRFYDALKLAQRETHLDPDDPSAPYFDRWRNMKKGLKEWGSSW